MNKRFLLSLFTALLAVFGVKSQVTNYALEFDKDGYVDCGLLTSLDGRESYLLQFWMNPSEWVEGANLISRGDGFKAVLGEEGKVEFTVGAVGLTLSGVPLNEWTLVTLRSKDGIAYVNGSRKKTALPAVPHSGENDKLILGGGGYVGRLDEVRIWGSALNADFDYFERTTLNRWNPNWDDLLVYFKMDDELCDNLVDYKSIYNAESEASNNHGIFSATGVARVVADNPKLPYLLNGAYTANVRFFDRAIPREQYLLSNDLIILGINSYADGHLKTQTPNNHARLEGCEYLDEFEGRKGVVAFDGNSKIIAPKRSMDIGDKGYTFECWLYVDEWVEGAYIYRKENADGQGFSISLGKEENHEMVVKVNGNKFVNQRLMKSNKWMHFALGVNGENTPSRTFWFMYNGKNVGWGSSASDESTDYTPVGNEDCEAVIGENFKGKIDDFVIWNRTIGRNETADHMNQLPMPGLSVALTADNMSKADTYYSFDDAERPGWSYYSQDEWRDIMLKAYEGHRGYQVRISVASHDGWTNTIQNKSKRKNFVDDLVEIAEGYDGVELDLEWIYGEQTYLGILSDEIRAALPEGKKYMVSCHNVAYRFPLKRMASVDAFTFQQYGPQMEHFRYSHFERMCNEFVNYGFPKEKIITSYSTTTSNGKKDGAADTPIRGVKDGFLEGDYVPSEELDQKTVGGGYTFAFTGPKLTYKRAKYTTDNGLGGIFYWDMGNDTPVAHPYNLAKWCSYGLNANVDTLVTSVVVRHQSSALPEVIDRAKQEVEVVVSPNPAENMISISLKDGRVMKSAEVFDASGRKVLEVEVPRADVSALPSGHYFVAVTTDEKAVLRGRFIKR